MKNKRADRKKERRLRSARELGMKLTANELGLVTPPTDGELNRAFRAKRGF